MKYIDFIHASVSQKKTKRLDFDKIYFDFKWMKYSNEVTTKTAKADDIAVSVLVITSSMISLRSERLCHTIICILSRSLVKDSQVSSHRWGVGVGGVW